MKRSTYSSICIFTTIFMCLSIHSKTSEDILHTTYYNSPNNKTLGYNYVNSDVQSLYPKEVFLTFDDGPCINNTHKILKILKDNNVKASFFVVGIKATENPEVLKEIHNSGMCIAVHTYSHDYKKIYKNLDAYLNDYDACCNVIQNLTGKTPSPYIRLPGGSTNLVTSKSNLNSIKNALNEKGIRYVDWNVCSGDAESHVVAVDKIKNNVMTQCKDKNFAVILMHDTYYKYFTVEALPDIINYLKNEGYVFRTFDDVTPAEESEMIKLKIINK
ncbi:polysaccharide deacetylase [Clostridium sp. P21]|uniref:Polysaccharide deacetylase n=1 Tax=Clostridium muellerianum TaxID=2716538 RepID=A0A7Y0EL92_9CLOT|nr:polysaccharide deacetylase family protein [Clostridium muellerianum]NMM64480.1 polysaccharide deacetylase [Clostridium muellerianum]